MTKGYKTEAASKGYEHQNELVMPATSGTFLDAGPGRR